ncbi:MAG TPA: hypothetical protein VHJ83_07740 [Micromonosporaceae bacterium]|jgi:hypothetical protein|nr:hypothetical protein [Micromonosporaceae bacterium]
MRTLLLFLVYYLVVTPVGVAWRIVRDPLHRARDRHRSSYWIEVSPLR